MQTLETTPYGRFCDVCDNDMNWRTSTRNGAVYGVAKCCGQTYTFVNYDGTSKIKREGFWGYAIALCCIIPLAMIGFMFGVFRD
jgi:hypothetical protein